MNEIIKSSSFQEQTYDRKYRRHMTDLQSINFLMRLKGIFKATKISNVKAAYKRRDVD